jgi:hypothetical protein
MKQFDKIFLQKAERAFSTFNADHLAEEGWNSFVSKRKGKKRFAVIIPLWAKAASVALVISTGGLFIYQSFYNQPYTYAEQTEFVTVPVIQAPAPVVSGKIKISRQELSATTISDPLPVKFFSGEDSTDEVVAINDFERNNEIKPVVKETDNQLNESADAAKLPENNLAEDFREEIVINEPADESQAVNKTSVIAGFSGLMSSIENMMVNSPGVSVGFYIEHRLTRRLSVRPGLALAKHSYGTKNMMAGTVFLSSPDNNGLMTGIDGSYENKLDILTMEVPVNMVYTIMERGKSSLFVSAGVSTMVYLDQNFSSSFTNVYTEQKLDVASGSVYEETRLQEVNVENDEKAFSHVDYFGLANLSAGYSMPLRRGGSMLFEPFLQLPVSDLTSFNVRIRYGGLSLKFRFGKEGEAVR